MFYMEHGGSNGNRKAISVLAQRKKVQDKIFRRIEGTLQRGGHGWPLQNGRCLRV